MSKIMTDEYIPEFVNLWKKGYSFRDIGVRFGIAEDTARRYAHRKLKLPIRKRAKRGLLADEEKMRFLRKNYKEVSADVCASLLGYSVEHIRKIAKELGLTHSKEYVRADYEFRGRKISATRMANHYPPTAPRGADGRFYRAV